MRDIILKAKMLWLIMVMSLFTFSLGFSAMSKVWHEPEKDYGILLDDYWSIQFSEEHPTIETVLDKINLLQVPHCIISFGSWTPSVAKFDQELFRALKIHSAIKDYVEGENVAVVNTNYQDMLWRENDQTYVTVGENDYRVLGYYDNDEENTMTMPNLYLDIRSKGIKEIIDYYAIYVDSAKKDISEELRQDFPEAEIHKWGGKQIGLVNTNPTMVGLILICAVIVSMNCISFAQAWISSCREEFEIRKMIGATDGSNHQLLLKRFVLMGIVALVVSWILDEITFTVLRSMRSLVHIRLLLGRYFYLDSILLAFLSMMLVIFVVLEIQWKVHRMRNEKY